MNEINYDAGRKQDTYAPHDIEWTSLAIHYNIHHVFAIVARYRLTHKLFGELVSLHRQRVAALNSDGVSMGTTGSPSIAHEYHLQAESWMFQIRRTLDSLVQYVDMIRSQPGATLTIEFDSISRFLHANVDPTSDVFKVIIGDGVDYEADQTDFLNVANDLFNSMKHCALHEEAMQLFCPNPNLPTVVSYYAKYNNFSNGATYLNHNAYHLMMGYQDTVCRILANIKSWLTDNRPAVAANMVLPQGPAARLV